MTLREELEEAGHAFRRRALDQGQLSLLANLLPEAHAARNLLWERAGLRVALDYLGLDAIAAQALGEPAIPVNAVLLDKTAGANWKVPGHQDLVMPVEREVDEPGFEGWTIKQGVIHVEPPVTVLETMVALRIHLDDCPSSNGALAVVPGSHRRGKLRDAELSELPREAFVPCEALAGDVLLMRPLLVHRSSPAETPAHRRVLHVVYASDQPGKKVRWKEATRAQAPAPAAPPVAVVPAEKTRPRPKRRHPVVRALESIVLLGSMLGGVGVVLDVVHQMRSGNAGKIYRTMWGYRLSYGQALGFCIAVIVASIAGAAIGHWQAREQRDFDRRYPLKPPGQ